MSTNELFVNRFCVTHHGRVQCYSTRIPFFPDVKVKSIFLHDTRRELPDKTMEGDSGWVLQRVLSRASCRRQPLYDQKTFTVLSLHIRTTFTLRDVARERSSSLQFVQ